MRIASSKLLPLLVGMLALPACQSDLVYVQYEPGIRETAVLSLTWPRGTLSVVPEEGVHGVLLRGEGLDTPAWLVSWKSGSNEYFIRAVASDDGRAVDLYGYEGEYYRAQTWPHTDYFPGEHMGTFSGEPLALLLRTDGTVTQLKGHELEEYRLDVEEIEARYGETRAKKKGDGAAAPAIEKSSEWPEPRSPRRTDIDVELEGEDPDRGPSEGFEREGQLEEEAPPPPGRRSEQPEERNEDDYYRPRHV